MDPRSILFSERARIKRLRHRILSTNGGQGWAILLSKLHCMGKQRGLASETDTTGSENGYEVEAIDARRLLPGLLSEVQPGVGQRG